MQKPKNIDALELRISALQQKVTLYEREISEKVF